MHGRTLIPFALCLAAAAATLPASGGEAEPVSPVARTHIHPAQRTRSAQRGKISWYGNRFKGRRTASGERFDPPALTMAHRSLPLGAIVDVTNNANGRHVQLRVNDRGPFVRRSHRRYLARGVAAARFRGRPA